MILTELDNKSTIVLFSSFSFLD